MPIPIATGTFAGLSLALVLWPFAQITPGDANNDIIRQLIEGTSKLGVVAVLALVVNYLKDRAQQKDDALIKAKDDVIHVLTEQRSGLIRDLNTSQATLIEAMKTHFTTGTVFIGEVRDRLDAVDEALERIAKAVAGCKKP